VHWLHPLQLGLGRKVCALECCNPVLLLSVCALLWQLYVGLLARRLSVMILMLP